MASKNDNLERLKALHAIANEDRVTPAQVAELFKKLITFIKDTKTSLDKRVDNALDSFIKRADAKLAQVKDGAKGDKGDRGEKGDSVVGPKGDKGDKGDSADPIDIDEALERVEKRLPQLGEAIVDSINLLPTDNDADKIDAKHIKNLPESKTVYQGGGGATAIWNLSDVSIAGIEAGQHLEWDGIKWVAVTPAGSGGTPVYGEVLHTQGVGTEFTLADTPIAGTVRLYRGGAYQAAGVSEDYTISSGTITLAVALVDGEKLLADYSHN